MDNVTLKRKSYVLDCTYIKIPKDQFQIVEQLHLIYSTYNIALSQIVKTVTNSGSSFPKAFRVFKQNKTNDIECRAITYELLKETGGMGDEALLLFRMMHLDLHDNESNKGYIKLTDHFQSKIQKQDVSRFEDRAFEDRAFEEHETCIAHQLMLVGSVDSLESNDINESYRQIYNDAFKSLDMLWGSRGNICQASTMNYEKTRWSSTLYEVIIPEFFSIKYPIRNCLFEFKLKSNAHLSSFHLPINNTD